MRFLVIRFSSLGDVVLSTAALEALKGKFPNCSVTFLSKASYRGLFNFDNRINIYEGIKGNEKLSEIREIISKDSYDAIIDLHGSLRSWAVSLTLKSPFKLRVKKNSVARRLMILSRGLYHQKFDVLGSITETLNPLGIGDSYMPKLLTDNEFSLKIFREIKGDYCIAAGIAPGAKHRMKIWSVDGYAAVGDELSRRGILPVFLGNCSDTEIIELIRGKMKNYSVSTAEKFGLAETVALVSKLKGVIANDSGIMHVAGALGVPVVGIFGPTHPDLGFWPGYNPGAYIHSGEKCSPCSVHGQSPCRRGKPFCMENITPETVIEIFFKTMDLQ